MPKEIIDFKNLTLRFDGRIYRKAYNVPNHIPDEQVKKWARKKQLEEADSKWKFQGLK